MLAWALPGLMSPNRAREEELKAEADSWLVEVESVGNRGCLTAAGDPELGEDPRDVDAGGLGGNEQRLADLPVRPALGDQGEHLNLSPGQAKRGSWRRPHLGRRRRVLRFFEAEAAALGEQLDLAAQRCRPERDCRLVGCPERGLGLLAGPACGQERLGLPEPRVGSVIGMLKPLPDGGRRPPPL